MDLNWLNDARSKYHNERYRDALKIIESNVFSDEKNPDIWNLKGGCYYHLGELSDAKNAWEICLQLDPNYIKAKTNLYLLNQENQKIIQKVKSSEKSDIAAKEAFVKELSRRGFTEIKIVKSPADINAFKNGKKYFFEVKYTQRGTNGDTRSAFGAATLTEWEAALAYEDSFRFVVVSFNNGIWVFHEYTPEEFMRFSTIPPFKVYFNVPNRQVKASPPPDNDRQQTVKATRENIESLRLFYKSLRYPDK